MAAQNRDELQTQIDSTFVPTLLIADHRTYLKDPQAESLVFRKDVIASQTPAGGSVAIDFSNKDLATVTTTGNLAVSFTGMENGDVKYLSITKNATNTISFTGATDVSQRKTYINTEVTLVVYRVTNKNNVIYVESINIDNDVSGGTEKDIIDLGVWNMDTTSQISIPYTFPSNKMPINMSVVIIEDGGLRFHPLTASAVLGTLPDVEGSVYYNGITGNFIVSRRTGGTFDSSSFQTLPTNRGKLSFDIVTK